MHRRKSSIKFVVFFLLLSLSAPGLCKNRPYTFPSNETVVMNDSLRKTRGTTFCLLSQGVTRYELVGPAEGKVVLLIHGMNLAMWVWDRQIEALVNAGFRVLRYDHFGRGLSDYPVVTYDQELYSRQIRELLDFLNITTPVHIVCHSFGGKVATYYINKFPETVDKLVYVAPGVKLSLSARLFLKSALGRRLVHKRIQRIPETIDAMLAQEKVPTTPYRAISLEQVSVQGFEASLASLVAHAIGDFRPLYRQVGTLKKDIMLIWGNQDQSATYKHICMARKAIPHMQYEAIEGVGHVPQFAATEQFNKLLVTFLQDNSE